MTRLDVDVAIAGSGFSGSILAAILQRHGLKVALIDRASHPRFAIGESSTPTANLILRDLADRYGLSWLRPLSQYGTWKQTYPHLTSGIKRGFAYFWHEPDCEFVPSAEHQNELLVAASSGDEISDTQWLRSDVDAFLFEQACGEGVTPFESTTIDALTALSPGWKLVCRSPEGPVDIHCRFLVDGTGVGGLLSQHLQIADDSARLLTKSRAVFGHFDNLPRWSSLLEGKAGGATADHPFDCDHSALHHLLTDGWMWWLRFDNDLTSVGVVLDDSVLGDTATQPATGDGVAAVINGFPDLKQALQSARLVAPTSGPVRTGRLQRLASRIAGADWAMLPHAAGFIDPLHSSGIAHSLGGVERLAQILLRQQDGRGFEDALADYESTVRSELLLIDQLVSGCYSALRQRSFGKFVSWSMCYFAAATSWERRRLETATADAALFLADDTGFRQTVNDLQSRIETESDDRFEQLCEERLAPFNHVGLFRPPVPNMYARTAVPDEGDDCCGGT